MEFQPSFPAEDALVKNHNVEKNTVNATMQDSNAQMIVNAVTVIMENQKQIIITKEVEWKQKSMPEFSFIYSFIFLHFMLFLPLIYQKIRCKSWKISFLKMTSMVMDCRFSKEKWK